MMKRKYKNGLFNNKNKKKNNLLKKKKEKFIISLEDSNDKKEK